MSAAEREREQRLMREHRAQVVAHLAATIYAGANSYSVAESVTVARQLLAEAERTEP